MTQWKFSVILLGVAGAGLGALLSLTPAARADVPSAANSTVDPCLRICPAGDMTFHVIVRNAANNPKPGEPVDIDFCQCPGVALCALTGAESYAIVSGCIVEKLTDDAGVADFQIRAGGTGGSCARVFAAGVLLRLPLSVSSPDQNGDKSVDAADQAILAGRMPGPYDPTGDFNCNATLDTGDQAILAAHLGHSCNATVPAWPTSWGRIKIVYR